jgi:short-subunit dehydrogenase
MRKAIIVGASSGIGRELARLLASRGYMLGLVARRGPLLADLQGELAGIGIIKVIDLRDGANAERALNELMDSLGSVDLVVISAGIGYINPDLDPGMELETIATNVTGFTIAATVTFRRFLRQGFGHLVGISSIAALRGSAEAPAYNASKAYVSNYLEGLRKKAARSAATVFVTDIQAGFVDTAMAQGEGLFWVAPVTRAATQILQAIEAKRPHAYVTKRWRLVAWLVKCLPRIVYDRI